MRSAAIVWMAAASCSTQPCFTDAQRAATGWADGERMFRGDRSWLGGDSAASVDLGGGRVLWMFGDTFVSRDASGSRSGAPFARNTVAIQHGYDPAAATVDFRDRRDARGTPTAFFSPDAPGTWMWPGHGARLGDALLVFLWRMRATSSGAFGFVADRAEAVLVANPDDDPLSWRMTSVTVPTNPWGVFVGTGAVVVTDGYVHVLSCIEPGNHDVYIARWPVDDARRGHLDDPEWATATDGGWVRQSALGARPLRLFNGHTEFTVHRDAATGRWVQLQATGFPGDLMMRTAPSLTGPWSDARVAYHPPELACAGVFTYAGRAHPELQSPALAGRVAVTYASNSSDFVAVVRDQSLYFPRFIRLDVAAGAASP